MTRLRVILFVEAASLVVASTLHSGILTNEPSDQAFVFEGSIAVILAIGLGVTFAGAGPARLGGLVTQAIAFAGASIGFVLALRGAAPNTIADVVYHVVLLGLIAVGLRVAWALPAPAAIPGRR